ncbi:MAG: polyprenyl synthetase family protein [Rhizobiales bacterium]|nr:polyprenyl synthetase family protein [Hyphomicrobiales bacterium]
MNVSPQFEMRLTSFVLHVEEALEDVLGKSPLPAELTRPARLRDAMAYAVLGGGKRLRPLLVVESAGLFGVDFHYALNAGIAFELLHCYSLVHDDLPAMDNDDTRRGKPTVHKAFDEATAILAGDALQTLAFDVLTRETTHNDPAVRTALVRCLAAASGIGGMAGGQMLDLEAEGRFSGDKTPPPLTIEEIERLQRMKTGALLSACCRAGGILGKADSDAQRALDRFGRAIGFAFQLADDLLDVEGSAEEVGKAVGKDAALNKATLVSTLGPLAARRKLNDLVDDAKRALRPFGTRAEWLTACADFVAARKS